MRCKWYKLLADLAEVHLVLLREGTTPSSVAGGREVCGVSSLPAVSPLGTVEPPGPLWPGSGSAIGGGPPEGQLQSLLAPEGGFWGHQRPPRERPHGPGIPQSHPSHPVFLASGEERDRHGPGQCWDEHVVSSPVFLCSPRAGQWAGVMLAGSFLLEDTPYSCFQLLVQRCLLLTTSFPYPWAVSTCPALSVPA